MKFINKIHTKGFMEGVHLAEPEENEIALFWLGQAGFLIKTPKGNTVAVDPCLSDFCEKKTGFKRLVPAVCGCEELECDILLISHEHEDHFDADLIEVMAQNRQFKEIWGPCSIIPWIQKLGLEKVYTQLEYEKKIELPGVAVTPVFSDHGAETPNAMGFVFDFREIRLYYAGDTAYSPELKKAVMNLHPDIAIMPINGRFGNLNPIEAYNFAKEMKCQVLVPCHYWMYAEHGGLPLQLLDMEKEDSAPKVVWLRQGEGWVTGPDLV